MNDREPFTLKNFVMFDCKECNTRVLSLKDFSTPNFIMEVYSLWNKFLTEVGDEFGTIDPKVLCKGFKGMNRPEFADDDGKRVSQEMEKSFGEALALLISQKVATTSNSICYNCLIAKARNILHLTDSKQFKDVAFNILLDWEMSKLLSKRHPSFYNLDWKEQINVIEDIRGYYKDYYFFMKLGDEIEKRIISIIPSFLTVVDYTIDGKKFNVTSMKRTWEKVE